MRLWPNGRPWADLLLGQLLSACLAIAGAISERLATRLGASLAVLQTTCVYATVALSLSVLLLLRPPIALRDQRQPKAPPDRSHRTLLLLLISTLDATASVAVLHAYRFLDMRIIALLATITTPASMLVSRVLLTRPPAFSWHNVVGAAVALAVIVLFAAAELVSSPAAAGAAPGYVLCVAAAFGYAVSNVLTEQAARTCASLPRLALLTSTFSALLGLLLLYAHRAAAPHPADLSLGGASLHS